MATQDESTDLAARVEREIAELRRSVSDMGHTMARLGRQRLESFEDNIADVTDELTEEGRHVLHQMNRRLWRIEKKVERSLRDHPREWLAGSVGVFGAGLLLGLILRHRD